MDSHLSITALFLSYKLLIPHTHKDRLRIVSENVKVQLFFFFPLVVNSGDKMKEIEHLVMF